MTIIQLLILAFIGEAVWETCKMFYQKGKVSIDRIGAAIVGLLIAFGAQVDLFEMVGLVLVIPYLGYVLTGLLISRGANVVHDIWNTINGFMTGVVSRGAAEKTLQGEKIIIPAKAHEGMKINIRPITKVKDNLKEASKKVSNIVASIRRPSGSAPPTVITSEDEPIIQDGNSDTPKDPVL